MKLDVVAEILFELIEYLRVLNCQGLSSQWLVLNLKEIRLFIR